MNHRENNFKRNENQLQKSHKCPTNMTFNARPNMSALWFVFCRSYQADTGNEEYKTEYAVNNKRFNIPRTARGDYKQYCSINKTTYSKDSKYRPKDSFDIHNFNFKDLLPRGSSPGLFLKSVWSGKTRWIAP